MIIYPGAIYVIISFWPTINRKKLISEEKKRKKVVIMVFFMNKGERCLFVLLINRYW